jgi:hypothetical protein
LGIAGARKALILKVSERRFSQRLSLLLTRQGLPIFLASVVLALGAAFALRDTPGWQLYNPDGSIGTDVRAYINWTRMATVEGLQDVYTRVPGYAPAVYGPVVLYPYVVVGQVYQLIVDPSFDRDRALATAGAPGAWLTQAFKVVAVGWHLFTGITIYAVLRWMTSRSTAIAGIAAGLYLINPAALLDAADWAQPDGAHTLFLLLAVFGLSAGHGVLAWPAVALAALAKPQAWVLLPFLALVTLRLAGPRALARGLALGAAVAVVVFLPFMSAGRPDALLGFPVAVLQALPVISGDAHNLWWIVAAAHGTNPLDVPDSTNLIGPVSYRATAAALVLLVILFAFWLYRSRRAELAEAAALVAVGWFAFTTGAHENHLAMAVALLALAWPARPGLLVAFAVVSVALLLNMVLQDDFFLRPLGLSGTDPRLRLMRAVPRTLNAVLILVCLAVWAGRLKAQQQVTATAEFNAIGSWNAYPDGSNRDPAATRPARSRARALSSGSANVSDASKGRR